MLLTWVVQLLVFLHATCFPLLVAMFSVMGVVIPICAVMMILAFGAAWLFG